MTVYADLAEMPEDARIEAIGTMASGGSLVGFVVESEAKADRYIAKLTRRFADVAVVDRGPGPVKGTILVRCSRKAESRS